MDLLETVSLLELNMLPINWEHEIIQLASKYSSITRHDGNSVTSRLTDRDKVLEVFVVTGNIILKELPWLYDLYCTNLLEIASSISGRQLFVSKDVKSAININLLQGVGSWYEKHVDTNPVTGILFVTNHPTGSGGQLIFELPEKEKIVIPRSGYFAVFDARQIVHYVSPLRDDSPRISVPMNYYLDPKDQYRPADLDEYLYGDIPVNNNE